LSIADDVKDAIGPVEGNSLLPSQLCALYDEEFPEEVETGDVGDSIAFTYSDGSVLAFSNEGLKVNNENVDPSDDESDED
jgi:hypothetical protein